MKLKRMLSCALALALALTMMALPAAAATFPDITNHWAKTYIDKMTDQGMFKGYDDGKFKPENKLTAADAVALCARAVPLDTKTADKIVSDRREEVSELLRSGYAWFEREFAICLETGILTHSELQGLVQSGQLGRSITREQLAMYLVRAMQLGPMAERLNSYSMSFSDVSAIGSTYQPYVYLLNIYGIVQGDTNNAFNPKGELTRAEMATMLSRALDFISERGVTVDLPDYTTYNWAAGTIAAVSSGDKGIMLLTLSNELTGQTFTTLSVPSDVKVYENNMLSATTALKVGRHVRVGLTSGGTPTTIRVSGSIESFTGRISGIDDNTIALSVNGVGKIVTMDRFTQVQISAGTVGAAALVDENAGYTNAECKLDDQGRLVALRLTGGTREEGGIFQSASKGTGTQAGSTILRVSGFDGVTRQYTAPLGAAILINGRTDVALGSSHAGSFISLRVSNEDQSVVSATVDTVTEYIQGAVKGVSANTIPSKITVSVFGKGKSVTYIVPDSAVITYNNEEVALDDIKKDDFVTIRLSEETVARMDAYPGSKITEGIVTNRTFGTGDGTTATLEVTRSDKSVVDFEINLASPPDIKRGGTAVSVDKIRVGDEVSVTVRFNTVIEIVAEPQDANVVGTVNRIVQDSSGSTLDMTLADGTNESYVVNAGVEITQGGKAVTLSAIKPGHRLAMVVNGEVIASIDIQAAAQVDGQITGVIMSVNTNTKEILLSMTDSLGNQQFVTVSVRDTRVIGWGGNTLSLGELKVGDSVQMNGAYDGAIFVAWLILRY